MPNSSKRAANQQKQQQQQQQSAPAEDGEYDEYVYYPYYPQPAPDGGYEYVQGPEEQREYEQPVAQYYDESAPDNAAPAQRT